MENFLENSQINREYKNDFFIFLFGKHKELALSLYNAMNNTDYDDPESIIFNTIEDFIYLGRKNDVSFLIENTLNIFEHQTTINPNIALRMLLYVAKLYQKYAIENEKDLYSQKLIKLPDPNFVVFYFGTRNIEDDRFVYLSEAMDIKSSNLELRVRVINANYGHNQHVLSRCPALYEYSWFLNRARTRYNDYRGSNMDNRKLMMNVVDEVLEEMSDDFIIKDIILRNKAEVAEMLYTIEDEPRMIRIHEEALRREGREEGKAEERKEGFNKAVELLMEAGFSCEEAKRRAEQKYQESDTDPE